MAKGAKLARPPTSFNLEAEIILQCHIEGNATATNLDQYVQRLPLALTPCEFPQFHQLCLNVAHIPLFAVDFYNVMYRLCCSPQLGNDFPGTVEGETLRVEELSGKSVLFS